MCRLIIIVFLAHTNRYLIVLPVHMIWMKKNKKSSTILYHVIFLRIMLVLQFTESLQTLTRSASQSYAVSVQYWFTVHEALLFS